MLLVTSTPFSASDELYFGIPQQFSLPLFRGVITFHSNSLYVSLREPSGAAEVRATRTFFDDNTRHNRARHTSAHTNGERHVDFSLWSEGSRCCSAPSRSSSFHAFVYVTRKTYQLASSSSSSNPTEVTPNDTPRFWTELNRFCE